MADFGAKYPYFNPVKEESENKLFADDGLAERVDELTSGSIAMETGDMKDAVAAEIYECNVKRKWFAIAQSLMSKTQMVFTNKTTGNLDKKTGETTLEFLCGCAKQFSQTLAVVTHNSNVAVQANYVVRLEISRLLVQTE